MELRLDHLLADLRRRPAEILAAIDADPLLVKRESGALVLANANQRLYTPQEQHQLYAKGIVYRRDPYRLVSLPLIKIYNVGERDVTVADLAVLADDPGVRLRFLRKIDGSLVQLFRADGRVWFSTRGMLEGARWSFEPDEEDRDPDFDFLGTARRLARERYPRLLEDENLLAGRTLVFELIHPRARKVTNYGERADLILLAAFDQDRFAYAGYEELADLASRHGLTVVDALAPRGATLAEQVDALLASLAGTDQEGSVLNFERGGEVIYRVKVKSPEYLQLMRLLAFCTFERTVEMLEANPQLRTWAEFRTSLQEQGRERVPEEVLGFYRQHYERHAAYLADCERLRAWAERTCTELADRLGGAAGKERAAFRKAFAGLARSYPLSGLVFAQLDGRLDLERVRKSVRSPREAQEALTAVGLEPAQREEGPGRGSAACGD
jgi:hypothetical protein